jgi:hypothetical protein
MRLILFTAAFLAGMWFDLRPAPAAVRHWQRPVAPWCAVYAMGWGETRWDCVYPSLEACVPFVIAGTRGFCNPNPRYPGPIPYGPVRRAGRGNLSAASMLQSGAR